MPQLEEWEIKKYWEIFSGLNPQNNVLTGQQAASVLKNSRLSDEELERIWDLADVDNDGNLDFEEFCVAMRLIFDRINGVSAVLPSQLPDWLVPSSKAHLVTAQSAIAHPPPSGPTYDDDTDDDGVPLRDDFDWYMSPEDKKNYEAIYTADSDRRGIVSFDAFSELYSTLDLPDTDVLSAWNLVNPKSDEGIGKDQALVFLHILNKRTQGFRVPRTIPASLRASFQTNQISYSLDDNAPPQRRSQEPTTSKRTFGESYLSRLGVRTKSVSDIKGTDFSATKGTDWEEVRLKRELENLEAQIQAATEARERRKREIAKSNAPLVKRELQQLHDYKREVLRKLESGDLNSGKSDSSLDSIREDIDLIKSQIGMLEEFAEQRKKVLSDIKADIEYERRN
ncbi:hypothetical protein CANCADRAFT_124246 [Tortispora caseinolytica NRRL Y-17796]|uniref:Actin cytoskeleton-regulatory complex protein END3 n=1 Tax=Tortispora caseinolytica NRRL Y-17796 TaxID=767744 RepID=A0A1E4T9U1_9ASCO|nr:hypothetical protein CANCADRAFT_124246 [Tortispora caseinolytica NRRL Y-17796]